MSRLIKLALVGRPNVGKSALFNAICKKKISIVDEAEGITRDRIYAKTEAFGVPFEIIDTGGMGRKDDPYGDEIRRQAEIAIEEADSIIMVVDGRASVLDIDMQVAKLLHRSKKPITLAINKIDNHSMQSRLYEYACLGIERMVAVSATHGYQIAELVQGALEGVPIPEETDEPNKLPHVAIIGRPNVGKSTLLNSLVGDARSIVSPIAGTTRDSIDTEVSFKDQSYIFIDTAGIRKRQKEKEVVEKFAHIRTEGAIERSDVCLLVIDVIEGITAEEKRIASLIEEAKKCCIVLLNKWDKARGFRMEHSIKAIEEQIPFLVHCPKICISALAKRNLDKIFAAIDQVLEAYQLRISTGKLNRCLTLAMQQYHPPVLGGKRLRVYYMTQVQTRPPNFVLFVNSPKLCEPTYKKYLVNTLRKEFGFEGVPILFQLKPKAPQKKKLGTSRHIDRDLPDYENALLEDGHIEDELIEDELMDEDATDEQDDGFADDNQQTR